MKSPKLVAILMVLLPWHWAVAQSSFTKITEGPVVTDLGVSPLGPAWGDLNNDGYLDVYTSKKREPEWIWSRIIGKTRWGGTGDLQNHFFRGRRSLLAAR